MIRNGYYCIYQGKEYRITHDEHRNIIIYTNDKDFTDATFCFDSVACAYKKIIDSEEIQEAYRISSIAVIDGDELFIYHAPGGAENMYWVESESKELQEKYNMEEIERGVHGTWIEKDRVQVVERKTNADYCFKKSKNL